jgi:transposase-like protein
MDVTGAVVDSAAGGDRPTLERWIRARTTPQRTVLRSRIVLLLAEGLSAREVARRLGVSRHTVDLWRTRYVQEGCDALTRDRPGRGRRRSMQMTVGVAVER